MCRSRYCTETDDNTKSHCGLCTCQLSVSFSVSFLGSVNIPKVTMVLLVPKFVSLVIICPLQFIKPIITARIRRMTGGYIFTLCVSSHLGGGYLPSGQVGGGGYLPSQVWMGGYPPSQVGGGVPTFPGGGGYLPFQVWGGGYLPMVGTPPPG